MRCTRDTCGGWKTYKIENNTFEEIENFSNNTTIQDFVEHKIKPVYDTFDSGHDSKHMQIVINKGLSYAKEWSEINGKKLNMNIVYLACALHDYGIKLGREGYEESSGKLI